VLTKVVYQLAELIFSEACQVLDSFYDLEASPGLIEKTVKFATQTLIEKGFVLGQDFKVNWWHPDNKEGKCCIGKRHALDCLL